MATVPKTFSPEHPTLHVPFVTYSTACGDLGPRFSCNRPEGHTGRHLYYWRNITAGPMQGQVRGVWR